MKQLPNKPDDFLQQFINFEDEEFFFLKDEFDLEKSPDPSIYDCAQIEEYFIDFKPIKLPDREKVENEYWPIETEEAVIEYLYLHENFYATRIKEEIAISRKKRRPINIEYCRLMYDFYCQIIEKEDSAEKREKIFNKFIRKPLNRLIENIIFKYRLFRIDVDVKTTHSDCYGFVYSKFFNFNPAKKKKSYSFYGTVAKHYLLGEKKELDKTIQINLNFEKKREEIDETNITEIHEKNQAESSFNLFEYTINQVEQEMKRADIPKNDVKVGDAIVQIFRNHEIIGAYNKNQVYQLIKERTGLQTKDITYSLHRFRIFYKGMKEVFIKKEDKKD